MSTQLSEEEMRRALFGAAHLPVHGPTADIPDVVLLPPATFARKKVRTAFTPRLRVTLQVGNVYEGDMQPYVHEANTLSTLLAEQDAVKAARKKYRYVEVVSVKAIG